jgi:hypothetical protein
MFSLDAGATARRKMVSPVPETEQSEKGSKEASPAKPCQNAFAAGPQSSNLSFSSRASLGVGAVDRKTSLPEIQVIVFTQ